MSVTIDTNVLVYAANEDDPAHQRSRELVERLAAGPTILYLFWPALLGYVRIVTHLGILPTPLSPRLAMRNVEHLIRLPHVRVPGELPGFWAHYRFASAERARGDDVPDAHLAALMRQHGVGVIYTRDQDFRRFDWIESRDPMG